MKRGGRKAPREGGPSNSTGRWRLWLCITGAGGPRSDGGTFPRMWPGGGGQGSLEPLPIVQASGDRDPGFALPSLPTPGLGTPGVSLFMSYNLDLLREGSEAQRVRGRAESPAQPPALIRTLSTALPRSRLAPNCEWLQARRPRVLSQLCGGGPPCVSLTRHLSLCLSHPLEHEETPPAPL